MAGPEGGPCPPETLTPISGLERPDNIERLGHSVDWLDHKWRPCSPLGRVETEEGGVAWADQTLRT